MKFVLKADIEFDAENLHLAFAALRDHFDNLADDVPEANEPPWFVGEMRVEPA